MPGPPQSHQWEMEICGVTTAFVITDFGSELLFTVSQSGKIASLIQATASEMREIGPELDPQRTFDVQVLFGDRRQEHYRALARALIELVAAKSSKPLLLGIHLRENSAEMFRGILQQWREQLTIATPEEDEFADYEGREGY
mmetsp:Transcript_12296/g.21139  ORF Transcript_12296/g.21139 Transcript_12296/m.21139 type:complete len:142 (-) Transcript_12296:28-453(-)